MHHRHRSSGSLVILGLVFAFGACSAEEEPSDRATPSDGSGASDAVSEDLRRRHPAADGGVATPDAGGAVADAGDAAATGDASKPPTDGGTTGDASPPLPPPAGAPNVLYTDIASGPVSGGERNHGAYLSIFGKNFGASGLGTTIRVYVNDVEVADYLSLGVSKARGDVERISVQVGALGSPPLGTPLPIKVVVGGVASNTDHTFIANPGRMLYVDPSLGNDATAAPGDVTKPWKTVQLADLTKGAWGQAKPGDTIVLRGGTYTSVGREEYFMRFITTGNGSGTAPTGQAGSGPIALVGYPGEDAFVNCTAATHPAGCIAGLNGENYPNAGKWAVVAGLRVEGGGYDGPISQEIYGDHWRVVNNELTALTGVTSGASPSRMAGITGNGKDAAWLGNHIHDIQGSQFEAHGIYIDGDGSYEIAYNVIHDCKSGKGIQTYANGGNGSDVINDVHIHHNVIHHTLQFGINVADGSSNGFAIYDNVVYATKTGGLRFNTTTLAGCKVWNNTFYDTNTGKNSSYGALSNDWTMSGTALDVRNNVFVATPGTLFLSGTVGLDGSEGTYTNNVWWGGTDAVTVDPAAVKADPKFVAAGSNFHLAAGSPAIGAGSAAVTSLVVDDYDATRRVAPIDIGAYQH